MLHQGHITKLWLLPGHFALLVPGKNNRGTDPDHCEGEDAYHKMGAGAYV